MFMWTASICTATGVANRRMSPYLVAIAVNEDGYREVLGAAEGMKEDKASWVTSSSG